MNDTASQKGVEKEKQVEVRNIVELEYPFD